jgi:hypothetical protein
VSDQVIRLYCMVGDLQTRPYRGAKVGDPPTPHSYIPAGSLSSSSQGPKPGLSHPPSFCSFLSIDCIASWSLSQSHLPAPFSLLTTVEFNSC